MVLINNYFRGMLSTPAGGTKHSGYGREHAIQTLQDFGYTKMIRFPSDTGTSSAWRGVTKIFVRGQPIWFTRSRDLTDHSQKGQVTCQQTTPLNPTQSR